MTGPDQDVKSGSPDILTFPWRQHMMRMVLILGPLGACEDAYMMGRRHQLQKDQEKLDSLDQTVVEPSQQTSHQGEDR
jgi:ribose 1,5-bisphosphokinase PhnN